MFTKRINFFKKKVRLFKPLVLVFTVMFTLSFVGCAAKDSVTDVFYKYTTNDLILNGRIESTQINVISEVGGKILEVKKSEGEAVKKGDVLAVLDSSEQELVLKQQEANLVIKQAKLDELIAGPKKEAIKRAEASVDIAKANLDEIVKGNRPEVIKKAEEEVKSAEDYYSYIDKQYKTNKSLYESGAISKYVFMDIEYKLEDSKTKLGIARIQLDLLKNGSIEASIASAKASYEQALAELELAKSGATSQAIKSAEAEVNQAKIACRQAELQLSKYKIVSPVDGTYITKTINEGETIASGTSIGKVSDLKDLFVKVYIPQKKVALASVNEEINLKTITLPGVTVKGKVTFVASQADFLIEEIDKKESEKNTYFEIKIKILDNIERLKSGMTVDAYFPK